MIDCENIQSILQYGSLFKIEGAMINNLNKCNNHGKAVKKDPLIAHYNMLGDLTGGNQIMISSKRGAPKAASHDSSLSIIWTKLLFEHFLDNHLEKSRMVPVKSAAAIT